MPGSQVDLRRRRGPDKRNYRVNCDKIAETLPGLPAAVDGRAGVEELYEAYQRHGLTLGGVRELALPAHQAHPRTAGRRPARRRPALACERPRDLPERALITPAAPAARPELTGFLVARRHAAVRRRCCATSDLAKPEAPLSARRRALRRLRAGADPRDRRRPRSCSASDYPYFSSFSDALLEHSQQQRRGADRGRAALGRDSLVVELASNDGYLLQYYVAARASRCSASTRPPGPAAGGRARRASRRCDDVLHARAGASSSRREGKRADVILAQQRAGPRRRPQRLRRRHRARCSRTTASR